MDLIGKSFGRLVVVDTAPRKNHNKIAWTCLCKCGKLKVVRQNDLRSHKVKSCGCLHDELASDRATTHNMVETVEYKSWQNMLNRCRNSNVKAFKNYGGRGIQVCKRWLKFENFISDMGLKPDITYTIERIKNDSGYKPSNCKWATRLEQARNQRDRKDSPVFTYRNKTQTLIKWCKELGLRYGTIHMRIFHYGYTFKQAISK